MAIDQFTKETFEAALPKHKETGEDLAVCLGPVSGEYAYKLTVKDGVHIMIRSSVRPNGIAADCGKDSIRAWLVNDEDKPLGSKIQSYVTRVNGWAERLDKVLRELWKRAQGIVNCPVCGKPQGVYKVKKDGPNKGRLFGKCYDHGFFRWMDEPVPDHFNKVEEKIEARKAELEPKTDADLEILFLNAEKNTITARVEALRKAIETDDGFALFALLKVYEYQTFDEQADGVTRHWNGVGFGGLDAEILTSFAHQYQKKNRLSPKQMDLARRKMVKYAGQIEKVWRAMRDRNEVYTEADLTE